MARVLVVDDETLFIALMRRALEQREHTVVAASDAQACRSALEQEPFDALVCDIMLPDGSGLHLMRDARRAHPHMGIVAISGGTSNGRSVHIDVLQIAKTTCADAAVKKPFELHNFVTTVEQVVALPQRATAER
jgi:CheY-like chemotaxis protein